MANDPEKNRDVDREIDDEKDVICNTSAHRTMATQRYKALVKEKCREYKDSRKNDKQHVIVGLNRGFSFVAVTNGRVSLEYGAKSNYERTKGNLNKEYKDQTRTTVTPRVASEENAPAVASGQVGPRVANEVVTVPAVASSAVGPRLATFGAMMTEPHSLSQTHNQIAGDNHVNHGPVHTGDVHITNNYNDGNKLGEIERKLDDLTLDVRKVDTEVQSVGTKVQSVNNKVDYMTPYKASKQGDIFTPPRQPNFSTPAAREPTVDSPAAAETSPQGGLKYCLKLLLETAGLEQYVADYRGVFEELLELLKDKDQENFLKKVLKLLLEKAGLEESGFDREGFEEVLERLAKTADEHAKTELKKQEDEQDERAKTAFFKSVAEPEDLEKVRIHKFCEVLLEEVLKPLPTMAAMDKFCAVLAFVADPEGLEKVLILETNGLQDIKESLKLSSYKPNLFCSIKDENNPIGCVFYGKNRFYGKKEDEHTRMGLANALGLSERMVLKLEVKDEDEDVEVILAVHPSRENYMSSILTLICEIVIRDSDSELSSVLIQGTMNSLPLDANVVTNLLERFSKLKFQKLRLTDHQLTLMGQATEEKSFKFDECEFAVKGTNSLFHRTDQDKKSYPMEIEVCKFPHGDFLDDCMAAISSRVLKRLFVNTDTHTTELDDSTFWKVVEFERKLMTGKLKTEEKGLAFNSEKCLHNFNLGEVVIVASFPDSDSEDRDRIKEVAERDAPAFIREVAKCDPTEFSSLRLYMYRKYAVKSAMEYLYLDDDNDDTGTEDELPELIIPPSLIIPGRQAPEQQAPEEEKKGFFSSLFSWKAN